MTDKRAKGKKWTVFFFGPFFGPVFGQLFGEIYKGGSTPLALRER